MVIYFTKSGKLLEILIFLKNSKGLFIHLTHSILGKIKFSADDILKILTLETICMKCQILFSGEKSSICRLLN